MSLNPRAHHGAEALSIRTWTLEETPSAMDGETHCLRANGPDLAVAVIELEPVRDLLERWLSEANRPSGPPCDLEKQTEDLLSQLEGSS